MRQVLSRYVDEGAIPGLVGVVARRGEVHIESIGEASVGGGKPVGPETIFRISSMTKPVTGVATMILLEECVLRLDDAVDEWLPELADRRVVRRIDGPIDDTVPAARPITVRDLLTFRMGFGGYFGPCPVQEAAAELGLGLGPPAPAAVPGPDEWMRRLGTLPLMDQPGERWMYHTGADVLGVLIARASGKAFPTFLEERIFDPLGMTSTGFFAGDAEKMTTLYDADLAIYDAPDGQWSEAPAFPSGADGLVSTASDFLAFAEMLLRGGAPVLSRSSVECMTTDHLTPVQKALGGFFPDDFDAAGWGFCVGVSTRRDYPWSPVGQYGWDGGLGTVWRNDPTEDLITILLTNGMWSAPQLPPVAQDFLTAAYASL